jgi:hypothetical protein
MERVVKRSRLRWVISPSILNSTCSSRPIFRVALVVPGHVVGVCALGIVSAGADDSIDSLPHSEELRMQSHRRLVAGNDGVLPFNHDMADDGLVRPRPSTPARCGSVPARAVDNAGIGNMLPFASLAASSRHSSRVSAPRKVRALGAAQVDRFERQDKD